MSQANKDNASADAAKELLAAAKLALPLMQNFFHAPHGKGTIKRLKQAITNMELNL